MLHLLSVPELTVTAGCPESCDKTLKSVHLCWTWLSPPLTVGYFVECWKCKPSVLLNIAAYSPLSSTGGLENTSLLSGPLWPVKDKDTNLIFKACCGFDLRYTTGPSCLHNHQCLRHQYSCIILCIHKLKKTFFFFLAMPELSSEYAKNNHEYSLLFFTCSHLARRGRNAAWHCSDWKTDAETERVRSRYERSCRNTGQITHHWNYHWPWHRLFWNAQIKKWMKGK